MPPSMTVPSAAMRRLRREGIRIRAALAPSGGVVDVVANKPPASSSLCRADVVGGTHARSSVDISFRPGTKVRVRTPVRLLSPGRHLVFWLHAVVVGADDDGHVDVVYCSYAHPGSDRRSGVVRVLKNDVKEMVQRPADVTASHSTGAVPSVLGQSEDQGARRRPTVAGKTPSVLRKIAEEMRSESESEDSLGSW